MNETEFSAQPGRVLVVDDEAPQREIIGTILESGGWEVIQAASAREAIRLVEPGAPDVILTDLRMAGQDGLALLAELKKTAPSIPIILMTAHGTVETAVRALKEGAFDYLTKPLGRDELILTLLRALDRVRLEQQNTALRLALEERVSDAAIVAEHGSMRAVMGLVAKVGPRSSTVLIYGETGTGKEVIARAIHERSPRSASPFVAINCAAIPENLLESELFGHERGAFTGAVARKLGLFERASGGTLFLDEVGDLPLALQPKLLRVLQEREIQRVGGTETIPVDVRVIAATHHDLSTLAKEGRFRDDLYWRLNVFPIVVPPLRDRSTDVPFLVEHFLARISRESGEPKKTVSPDAMKAMSAHRWPGNVRELQSVTERATVMAEGSMIELEDLPTEVRSPASKVTLSNALDFEIPEEGFVFEDLEKQVLLQAMERSGGVIARAAKLLGMTYRTLQYRLEKYGLRAQDAPPED